MITDPFTVRAKQPGVTIYRVFRGAPGFVEDALGHQRDVERPWSVSTDHGLRLSVTLALPPSGAAPHKKERTRGDAEDDHRSRLS